MKRTNLKSSLFAGLLALLAVTAKPEPSLKDITKPYLGEYECQSARLGDTEYLDGFQNLILELKEDGVFFIRYQTKQGKRGEAQGEYAYDAVRKQITLSYEGGYTKSYPLIDGALHISFPVCGKMMIISFRQK